MKSKKWLFIPVFAGIVFIDWLYATQYNHYRMIAVSVLGILMGLLTLPFYPYDKEKYKKLDLIWSGLWIVGSVIGGYVWVSVKGPVNMLHYFVVAIDVGILGLTFIRVVFSKFWKRTCRGWDVAIAIVFGVMSLWMVCSRNYEIWQIWFYGMFLCFYLTKVEDKEEDIMWDCLSKGFILAFFLLQIWAYGFRPYDEVRYLGPYGNTNMTALFYLVTYMMVLYRIHVVHCKAKGDMTSKAKRMNSLWMVFYYVLAGSLVSFIFFTICRTALLVLVGLTFLFGIISNLWLLRERVYRLILRWGALVLCAVITFPCVYGTIRYFPCILHRPVWFAAEYSTDKVHSFDPWDSWKYISLEEFFETAVGRIRLGSSVEEESVETDVAGSVEGGYIEESYQEEVVQSEAVPVVEEESVEADVTASVESVVEESCTGESQLEAVTVVEDDGLLRGEDALNSGKIRLRIWKHYLSDLTWNGHTQEEGYIPITEDYHAFNAQNVFLQMLYYHGIPAGILFGLLMIWYGVMSVKILYKAEEPTVLLPGMVFVVFIGFGMLECVWYSGQAILILMYLLAKRLLRKKEKI